MSPPERFLAKHRWIGVRQLRYRSRVAAVDRDARRIEKTMFEKLPRTLQKLFGMTLGWAFFAFAILAVPASVVTLMRWFQLPWWGALIGVFLITLVPYAGRFAYFGLSLIGLYYVIEAGFSFPGAVGPFVN
jgi:hypothetical protein